LLKSQDLEILKAILRFLTTPYGKIFKILFQKFSPPHRSTLLRSNVVKKFPTGNRRNRALFAGQKISAASQTVATARIMPKIRQG